jgi:hypothetical protein
MKDKWMNMGYEEEDLKPYVEPVQDWNDIKRIEILQVSQINSLNGSVYLNPLSRVCPVPSPEVQVDKLLGNVTYENSNSSKVQYENFPSLLLVHTEKVGGILPSNLPTWDLKTGNRTGTISKG